MSKRRINKQQAARIKKIQTSYQESDSLNVEQGLVLSRFSRHAEIEDLQGNRVHCSIRPNIDTLVAGDQVIWERQGENRGVVVSVYPRKSVIGRTDKKGNIKPFAANISQIIVVVACKPEISWTLLDSYLVMVENLGLKVCIVLNKIDLACDSLKEELLAHYSVLGYQIVFLSKHKQIGYPSLIEALNNQTSVFVGQSGVGKSSIISEILPHELSIQTAEISNMAELGCHTTSNSRFYHLPSGGALIDSPGIREMSLGHLNAANITQGFPEIRSLISLCKFRNCSHFNCPGCAVLEALHSGTIAQKRYENYLKIRQTS